MSQFDKIVDSVTDKMSAAELDIFKVQLKQNLGSAVASAAGKAKAAARVQANTELQAEYKVALAKVSGDVHQVVQCKRHYRELGLDV